MDIDKYKNWNEFDWEFELKQEDMNVNSYIAKLTQYLDLPNESDAIRKHLSHNNSMPGNTFFANNSDIDIDIDIDDELDDEAFFDSADRKSNSEIYLRLGDLASEFSCLISSVFDNKASSIGIKVLCFYGSTISKALDMEELENGEMVELKKALVKRVVSNINKIIGSLNELINCKCLKDNIDILESQISKLFELREQILDIQFSFKLA